MKGAAPEQIGPYRIVDTLGQGGMGVVYRARRDGDERTVALKTVHVPHEGYYNSLRREVRALAAIDHPGVVSILDQGVDRGVPWYTMKLVAGPTLRVFRNRLAGVPDDAGQLSGQPAWWTQTLESLLPSVVSELPPPVDTPRQTEPRSSGLRPRGLRRVLRVLLRLAETLAVVHAAGIVHADLKPENVLVGSSDRPVLVDFGLTARFVAPDGREPLEARMPAGGSFAYMAPEQIRGELFDARADLYAFGCLLFEMISGRPAFMGESPHQLVLAQMALDPPPLSRLVENLPSELDALVDRLLAKEPRFRLGHSSYVARQLANIVNEPLELGELPPPHLYRPALAGRHRELQQLMDRVSDLRAGRGGLVAICGERGVGKTRLAAELASRARAQGLVILSGEHTAGHGSRLASLGAPLGPLQAVMTALVDRCRQGGPDVVDSLLGDRGPILADVFEAVATFSAIAPEPPAGELTVDAARLRLFRAVLDTLIALSERAGPIIVVLDDVHLADELTRELLKHVANSGYLDQHRVLIIATYRAARLGPDLAHYLGQSPSDAVEPAARADGDELGASGVSEGDSGGRLRGVEVVMLSRLDQETVADVAADMLGLGEAPGDLASHLHEMSRGNPFFVAELLRAAVNDGLLTRDHEGAWELPPDQPPDQTPLPLPTSVRDLIRRRLERLEPAERRLVSAAAVLDREAPLSLLAELAKVPPEEAAGLVHRLFDAEMLAIRGDHYEVAHRLLGEVAYALEPRIAAYHGRAARLLREQIDRRKNIDTSMSRVAETLLNAEIGDHLVRAGRPDEALPFLLDAARHAVQHGARRDAARLYEQFLSASSGVVSPDVIDARLELARDVLAVMGRLDEATASASAALAEARGSTDGRRQVSALCQLSNICHVRGLSEEAQQYAESAAVLADELADPDLRARVTNRLATLAMRRGHFQTARQLGEQALELASVSRRRVLLGDTHALLGVMARARGDLVEAESHGRQAIRLHRAGSDPVRLAVSLAHLGRALDELGRRHEALDVQHEALEIFRRVGDRRWESIVLGNMASTHGADGELEAAARDLEDASVILAEIGDRSSWALQQGSLGRVREQQERFAEAEALYEEALATLRAVDDTNGIPLTLCRLARVRRRLGQPIEQVAALLDEAEAALGERRGGIERAVCLCERGHLALIQAAEPRVVDRRDEPQRWLDRALETASEHQTGRAPYVAIAIQRLARAVDASEAGRPLRFGEVQFTE